MAHSRCARSLSPVSRTLLEAKIHSSSLGFSPSITSRIALPTRPLPPVTKTIFFAIVLRLDEKCGLDRAARASGSDVELGRASGSDDLARG